MSNPEENPSSNEQIEDSGVAHHEQADHPYTTHKVDRRTVLKGGTAAAISIAALFGLHKIGIPGAKKLIVDRLKEEGFDPELGEEATEEQYFEEAEHLIHKWGIGGINAIGFLSFVDAVAAIGLKNDSYLQKSGLFQALGFPSFNTGEEMGVDEHGHEKSKFPLENAYLAMVLHALRIAIDHHAGEHSISEIKTTAVGVGMLSFFTSFAKGMNSISEETDALAHVDGETIVKQPNEVLAKSIFQLTMLASMTQFPMFAFGNASIGNEQFPEVQAAYKTMYMSVLPGGHNLPKIQGFGQALLEKRSEGEALTVDVVTGLLNEHKSDFPQIYDDLIEKLSLCRGELDSKMVLEMMMETRMTYICNVVIERADNLDNKEVGSKIKELVLGKSFEGIGKMREALLEEALVHSNDLMVLLMATACDDTQAAAGDLGPLVGLFQAYGPNAACAIAAAFPYTMAIGAERALFACKRSGVPLNMVFNNERRQYAIEFWKTAMTNLTRHFVSKFSRHVDENSDSKVGVKYSVTEQMLEDLKAGIGTVWDAGLGTLNGDTLNYAKVKEAIKTMKDANARYSEELGNQVREKARRRGTGEENIRVRISGMGEIKERIKGNRSKDPKLNDLQCKLNKLSLNLTDEEISSKTPEIQEFLAVLKGMEGTFYDELKVALDELKHQEGRNTPSIQSVATLLQKNPKITDLLDFNYWHDRLGPELTDTIFVVTLQGLHLPFIIETVQIAYDSKAFKSLPLTARNWLSAALNNGISSVADNWADAIAHAYWLKKMYFDEVDKFVTGVSEDSSDFEEYGIGLAKEYPEVADKLANGFFKIENEADKNLTEQFEERKQQYAALIKFLIEKHPEDADKLNQMLISILDKFEDFYWKSMNIALITAVTGGGKLLTGNAPHFTYAADIDEFDFQTTLADLKNHPLYHLWEFVFSTTYSTVFGPAIAKGLFGQNSVKKIQKMMQKKFKDDYPIFYKKINELKANEEGVTTTKADVESTRGMTRRALFRKFTKVASC